MIVVHISDSSSSSVLEKAVSTRLSEAGINLVVSNQESTNKLPSDRNFGAAFTERRPDGHPQLVRNWIQCLQAYGSGSNNTEGSPLKFPQTIKTKEGSMEEREV
jgi:hypothetical protein